MSLREQLREIFPQILPHDPQDAIKGTELIRLIRFQLKQNYSDATLRYHFSVMSCDPSAPIAKVAQGQGYYLRPDTQAKLGGARHLIAFRQQTMAALIGKSPTEINRDLLHAERFRAIVHRHLESNNRFPFFFEEAFGPDSPPENVWHFPDAAIVDWPVGEATEHGYHLAPKLLRRYRTLNTPLYRITALKLRLRATHESLREEFFQCLSHGEWAHAREFYIAMPVEDASLADALSELGQRYGVGVLSLGFSEETLDDLPEARAIQEMKPEEFDALLSRANFSRLSAPENCDQHPSAPRAPAKRESADMEALFSWIEDCLDAEDPRRPQSRECPPVQDPAW